MLFSRQNDFRRFAGVSDTFGIEVLFSPQIKTASFLAVFDPRQLRCSSRSNSFPSHFRFSKIAAKDCFARHPQAGVLFNLDADAVDDNGVFDTPQTEVLYIMILAMVDGSLVFDTPQMVVLFIRMASHRRAFPVFDTPQMRCCSSGSSQLFAYIENYPDFLLKNGHHTYLRDFSNVFLKRSGTALSKVDDQFVGWSR
jgi:hypothetical protein